MPAVPRYAGLAVPVVPVGRRRRVSTLELMSPTDPVPEADHLEQEMPQERDERELRPIPPDAPDADVLEQELPASEVEDETGGLDAERIEPLSDDDRMVTGR